MGKIFNIAGPCNPSKHYMLSAMARLPKVCALIGMRNIRDYKARIRPDQETLGSASPFNVITKAMTLRIGLTHQHMRVNVI